MTFETKQEDYKTKLRERLQFAITQRNLGHEVFNDMDYLSRYDLNRRNGLAYTRPRKNKEERLIVTGSTRTKKKSILSALLNYNLEAQFIVYDKDNYLLSEFGKVSSDLVKKSRSLEQYDDKRPLIYSEALDQGTWFVEELWSIPTTVDKKLKGAFDPANISSIKWTSTTKQGQGLCTARLVPGKYVYLGNVRQKFMELQPYLFTEEYMSYEECKVFFEQWEKWSEVSEFIQRFSPLATDGEQSKTLNKGVQVLRYYDKFANDFNIILNGILMLPEGFPMTAVSPSGEYPIVKGDLDPTQYDFAYSKSFTDDIAFDQILIDEFIRTILFKAQQGATPPMVNNSNRELSRDIFNPAAITRNLNKAQIVPLLDQNGISTQDVGALELIRKVIDEKSVSPIFTGDQQMKQQTAYEISELKKAQLMKLGLLVYGIVQFEQRLAKLRMANIMANWTKPIDSRVDKARKALVDKYMTLSVDSTDDTGRKVERVIEFSKEKAQLPDDFIKRMEDFESAGKPTPVRYTFIDPEALQTFDGTFECIVTPTEKDSSELQKQLWLQNITQGLQLFGQQAFNMEYLKERYAVMSNEDPNRLFAMASGAMPGAIPGATDLQAQVTKPATPAQQSPSLTDLVQ